jgi:hypothetical protein
VCNYNTVVPQCKSNLIAETSYRVELLATKPTNQKQDVLADRFSDESVSAHGATNLNGQICARQETVQTGVLCCSLRDTKHRQINP